MRTVIYARFSSQLQNSRSIDDQVAICRDRCEREGWPIVEVFADYAISGAAGIDGEARPGLNSMLERIRRGGVDQVLAESTDRLARHQGDSFAIREQIEYAGARLFTLLDGEVDEITGTIKGLFDARFRKDLGARIRRGQRGTIASGRSPAGLAYGYRKANRLDADGELIRGLREVDPDQAPIVRRIFDEYVAGESPRAIAQRLNEEGVPAPRGGAWRSSTIAGDRVRQNGILQNRLYAGELVHARTTKRPDPTTRKTKIRATAESDWISRAAPELRIVDQEIWEKAQQIRARFDGQRPEQARRPKHLLSGLTVCGICAGGFMVIGAGRWGCGRHRDGRGCSNNRTIGTEQLERRVLAGLQGELLDPELVAIYVREYHLEHARRSAELGRGRNRLERRQAELTTKVDRLVEAIGAGADLIEVREALDKARREREGIAGELAELEALPVVAIHPTIAADYRRQVERLNATLARDDEEGRRAVVPILRGLIEQVSVTPSARPRGVEIEVTGRLTSVIALATGEAPPEYMLTAERVKGVGRYHTFLRARV